MAERVKTDIDGHVATLSLNRAEKKNAVDIDMFEAIPRAVAEISGNPTLRAVILTGEGSDFCAGIDVSAFAESEFDQALGQRMQPGPTGDANFFQAPAMCLKDLGIPVIAALRGVVLGAGFQIAMGADIRIAAPDVRLSILEIKWGLVPDMGITATMRNVCAVDKVSELAMTGRMVSADEALANGLVTRIAEDPLAEARQLANEIAGKSPDAIRAIKRLMVSGWTLPRRDALRLEAESQLSVMGGDNQREAVHANLEKRPPDFKDPG